FLRTQEFAYITLATDVTTGSSIMPQKRNPDAAELVRAKAGRVIGALTSLLIVMKGLPLAYSKDMQEDKEAAFDALDALSLSLAAMTGMVRTLTVNEKAMRAAASRGFSTATDLADWLVRALNLPFRQAHHVTGALVARAEKKGIDLDGLSLDEMREVEPGITDEVYSVLGVDNSVASRTSFGGTSPENVRAAAKWWRDELGRESSR
ncbi:MAG TPA: argininosuccinate lyase, partial [Rhodobiaceae bacterium]|nr:argininosuccinate lyase [Rhodobiaceae bacterium]